MFRPEFQDDFSVVRWALHHTLATIGSTLGGIILLAAAQGRVLPGLGPVGDFVLEVTVVWGVGFSLGRLMHRWLPDAVGRWVWVIPAFLLLIAFTGSAVFSSFGTALESFTIAEGVGEGWVIVLLTLPAAGSVGYAYGVATAARGAHRDIRETGEPIDG